MKCKYCDGDLSVVKTSVEVDEEQATAMFKCKTADCSQLYRLVYKLDEIQIINEDKGLDQVDIYTDGACKGNPGPGGWGYVIIYPNKEEFKECGGLKHTTNNQMELLAPIMALDQLKSKCSVSLYVDSGYVYDMFTKGWIDSWKKNGWKTAAKKKVKNKELIERLCSLVDQHEVAWIKVEAHTGDEYNEVADYLANKGISLLSA